MHKARNEYLLSLASVNAAVSNYYPARCHGPDGCECRVWGGSGGPGACAPSPPKPCPRLSPSVVTQDSTQLGQVLRSYTAAESRIQASQMQGLGSLEEAVDALDPVGDKAKVQRCPCRPSVPTAFRLPAPRGDEGEVSAQPSGKWFFVFLSSL